MRLCLLVFQSQLVQSGAVVSVLASDFNMARTLGNHMLETAGQAIDFESFHGNFTCLLSGALVTRARDVPARDRSLIVSAVPRRSLVLV